MARYLHSKATQLAAYCLACFAVQGVHQSEACVESHDGLEACSQGKQIWNWKDYSNDAERLSSVMKAHTQLEVIYLPRGSRSGSLEMHC